MKSFWDKLPKPFFSIAPMADVTDAAFRRMFAKYGKPDVLWTEFVSADGLFKGGYDALVKDLTFDESERPIVAQFFTADKEMMARAARLAHELGFDGVDINMGCPDQAVCKQGAGAALMKNPQLARELIRVAKEASPLPVSVKTRIGYTKNELATWLPELLAEEPAAIVIHARTKKEMSKVPANWDAVAEAVRIRDIMKSKTLIIGNGDVSSRADGEAKAKLSGADGVMVGRGVFGNPWFFANRTCVVHSCPIEHPPELVFKRAEADCTCITVPDKLHALVEHTYLFEQLVGGRKSFAIMKKHYKAYAEGFRGAKELRTELMEAGNGADVEKIIDAFLLGR